MAVHQGLTRCGHAIRAHLYSGAAGVMAVRPFPSISLFAYCTLHMLVCCLKADGDRAQAARTPSCAKAKQARDKLPGKGLDGRPSPD